MYNHLAFCLNVLYAHLLCIAHCRTPLNSCLLLPCKYSETCHACLQATTAMLSCTLHLENCKFRQVTSQWWCMRKQYHSFVKLEYCCLIVCIIMIMLSLHSMIGVGKQFTLEQSYGLTVLSILSPQVKLHAHI